MTQSALEQLLDRARGPMGPAVELDFGVTEGPIAQVVSALPDGSRIVIRTD